MSEVITVVGRPPAGQSTWGTIWIATAADGDSDFNNLSLTWTEMGETPEDTVEAFETDVVETDESKIANDPQYEEHTGQNSVSGTQTKLYIGVAGDRFWAQQVDGSFRYYGPPAIS